jgi:AcrR family transcriptional regulator
MPQADKAGERYHHGNLAAALVIAGRAILEEEGLRGFSLRAAARRAGVSHAAPAHHFASLGAFLSECAASAFAEFDDALRDARRGEQDPARAIAAMGRAYLGFAAANPAIFRLMFDRSACGERTLAHLRNAEASYETLVASVRALDPAVAGDALARRVDAVWSLTHGYAHLMLEGFIGEAQGPDLREATESAAAALTALTIGFKRNAG